MKIAGISGAVVIGSRLVSKLRDQGRDAVAAALNLVQPNRTFVGAALYFDRASGDEWLEDTTAPPPGESAESTSNRRSKPESDGRPQGAST